MDHHPQVTIGIKALNEASHIAECLASAVDAAKPYAGSVVLADSGSTDGTIEIAKTFPIEIYQLANFAERRCGAGAQLAFQHVQADYFYLLDGDMTLEPGFLAQGIAYLEAHPKAAGVGGRVVERNVESEDFQIRAHTTENDQNWQSGEVDRLDCGGLYRVAAVREVGYFADRNLHSFEEFDLAVRLRSQGWTLARLDVPAVNHYGHQAGGYRLLWRRIQSGYSGGLGELLRAALAQTHLPGVLRFSNIRHALTIIVWWFALLASLLSGAVGVALFLLLAPIAFLCVRRKSLRLGLYSFASWNVSALGLLSGFLQARTSPTTPLSSRLVHTPGAAEN